MQTPSGWNREKAAGGNAVLEENSDVAPTKYISSGADNQAVRWTIGCKPSANSKAERFRARRQSS